MDFAHIMSWGSYVCFFAGAIIHFYFFVYELWLLPKPQYYRQLGYSAEQIKSITPWAKNQSVYNLCLSLGTIYGLTQVLQKNIMVAGAVTSLCGLTMVAAGITLWSTQRSLRRFALLQVLPPLIGFLFLALHILERLRII